jgi:hypothetical protein
MEEAEKAGIDPALNELRYQMRQDHTVEKELLKRYALFYGPLTVATAAGAVAGAGLIATGVISTGFGVSTEQAMRAGLGVPLLGTEEALWQSLFGIGIPIVAKGVGALGKVVSPVIKRFLANSQVRRAERSLSESFGATRTTPAPSLRGPIADATEVRVSEEEYRAALQLTFPSQYADQIARTVDGIGQRAAQLAARDPRFVSALQSRNWKLAGTLFHSAAAQEARSLPASALPSGWVIEAEIVIQSGPGGSRADIFLRGPAGQIIEFDWKTTGRSALSSGSRSELARHAGQISTNINGELISQESRSWVDYVRALVTGVQF